MKLEYYDLLSPEPINIDGVGGVISPKLSQIDKLRYGIKNYYTYLYYLLIPPKELLNFIISNSITTIENWSILSEEDKDNITKYDIIITSTEIIKMFSSIFDFFIVGDIIFNAEYQSFLVYDGTINNETNELIPTGIINNENFNEICDIILERNNRKPKISEDLSRVKNKKALEILKKMQKHKEEQSQKTNDEDSDLGNIISKICVRSKTINHMNIREMTVYQIYDLFDGMILDEYYVQNRNIISSQADGQQVFKTFKITDWFKKTKI